MRRSKRTFVLWEDEMGIDMRRTKKIESLIISQGADLVGIAPIERFKNAPEGFRPNDYMRDATCVISIGIHVTDGVCDAWGEYSEPGKSITPYLFYGYGLINLQMARIADLAARQLESMGHRSLTFPPTWAISMYRSMGLLREDYMGADFSHRHAAVAAGLGQFGWSGLVLTPDFGSRVRLNSIITNAPLAPSPMYNGNDLCQPKRCKYLCVKICPAEALSEKKAIGARIDGHRFKYTRIDMVRCMYAIHGLVKGSGSFGGVEIPRGAGDIGHFWKAREQQDLRDKVMIENCFGLICGDFCGKCLHQCPAHLYRKPSIRGKRRVQQTR